MVDLVLLGGAANFGERILTGRVVDYWLIPGTKLYNNLKRLLNFCRAWLGSVGKMEETKIILKIMICWYLEKPALVVANENGREKETVSNYGW